MDKIKYSPKSLIDFVLELELIYCSYQHHNPIAIAYTMGRSWSKGITWSIFGEIMCVHHGFSLGK